MQSHHMAHTGRLDVEGGASVRGLPLLTGETVEELFTPGSGLVQDSRGKDALLVLTNQRIISFVESEGVRETLLASLAELKGVSVKAHSHGLKHISQGAMLILGGILAYLIVGYILDGVAIALALGLTIVFVGLLFIAKHFLWEEEGTITFQGGVWERSQPDRGNKNPVDVYKWELSFPYKGNRASAEAYLLANRFFQLKEAQGLQSPGGGQLLASPAWEPQAEPGEHYAEESTVPFSPPTPWHGPDGHITQGSSSTAGNPSGTGGFGYRPEPHLWASSEEADSSDDAPAAPHREAAPWYDRPEPPALRTPGFPVPEPAGEALLGREPPGSSATAPPQEPTPWAREQEPPTTSATSFPFPGTFRGTPPGPAPGSPSEVPPRAIEPALPDHPDPDPEADRGRAETPEDQAGQV